MATTDQVSDADLLAALRDWSNPTTRRHFLLRSGLVLGGVAVSGAVADFLAACASGSPSTTGTTVVKGGHVTYGNISDVHELIPQQRPSLNAEWIVQSMLFDGLIAIGTNADIVLQLAESPATFSSDGLTATFKMRKDAKWSDGQPVTAHDVVFSYNLDIDPTYNGWNAPSRNNNGYLAKVVALDDYTVQFTSKTLDSNFALIGNRLVAPQHILGSLSGTDLNTTSFATAPTVTCGAFTFDHWDKGSQIVLNANKKYYRGAPNIDHWVYKQLSANQNLADLLQTGEVDYGVVDLPSYDRLSTVSSIDLITFKGHNDITNILMNLDPKRPSYQLFGDKTVRQALAYAVDRAAMVKPVFSGHAVVPNGIVLVGSWAYNENVVPKYTYDKAKAESLLDGAGWTKDSSGKRSKNGVPLAWTMVGYNLPEFALAAQICQQYWSAIGCDVTLKLGDVNFTVNQLLNDRNWAMMVIDFGPNAVVPDIRIYVDSRNTGPGGIDGEQIISTQLDQLMAQAASTLDKTKAKPIWDQIQNLMADECWIISLLSRDAVWASNKRVKGAQFSLYNSFDTGMPWINKVWVTDGK